MKPAFLLILSLLIFGCAAKQMTARNADILLELQIEKKLPLYSAQKQKLKKDVDAFLNQQKPFAKEAIPVITSIELDVNKVNDQYGYLNSLYLKLALNFSKFMSKYMAQLDEKQQQDFEKTLKEENQSLRYSKADDRIEKIEDRFETLFGTITKVQKKILESYKTYFEERHALRLSRR